MAAGWGRVVAAGTLAGSLRGCEFPVVIHTHSSGADKKNPAGKPVCSIDPVSPVTRTQLRTHRLFPTYSQEKQVH